MRVVQVESGTFCDKIWMLTIHFESMRKIWPKLFQTIILKIQSENIYDFCSRTWCMTLVHKLGILCLSNYEIPKTGRRSPFYLNCSYFLVTKDLKHPDVLLWWHCFLLKVIRLHPLSYLNINLVYAGNPMGDIILITFKQENIDGLS